MPSHLVEVDYHQFQARLTRAADSGSRIDPTDTERWRAWVSDHGVKEAACRSVVRSRGGSDVRAVIIDDGGDWDGYYVYSADDEMCFRFSRE